MTRELDTSVFRRAWKHGRRYHETNELRAARLTAQAGISEANRLVRRGEPDAPRNAARIQAALAKRARRNEVRRACR